MSDTIAFVLEVITLMADGIIFSMRQVTRPFAIWGHDEVRTLSLLYPTADEQASYFGTRLLATVQSILSLGLVTLFLLAVRRRFRME